MEKWVIISILVLVILISCTVGYVYWGGEQEPVIEGEELIKENEQASSEEEIKEETPISRTTINPNGKIKVLIFEVKPSDFYDREEIECCYDSGCTSVDPALYDPEHCNKYTVISIFNRREGIGPMPSIYTVKDWYENQAKEYGVTDLNIEIDIAGPFIINNRFEYGFNPAAEVADFFKEKLVEEGYNRSDYHLVHYIYFDDIGFNPNISIFGFRSFSNRYDGNTFNAVSYGPRAIQTIMHEMGHTFDGDDLYSSEGWGCKVPEGIPDPEKPLSAQDKACLMCGKIATSENSGKAVNDLNKELVICNYTAKKFGWI